MVSNSSRLRWRDRKAAALAKKTRQHRPRIRRNEGGTEAGGLLKQKESGPARNRQSDARWMRVEGLESRMGRRSPALDHPRLMLGGPGDVQHGEVLDRDPLRVYARLLGLVGCERDHGLDSAREFPPALPLGPPPRAGSL
jgi:hypothetical protein